jgi:nucleotide-binding universal stress UspA family protein
LIEQQKTISLLNTKKINIMKKILVPVDFSEHTDKVCHFALEIAKKTGAEIRLFHAYFDYVIVSGSSFPYSIDINELFNQEMMIKVREDAQADIMKLEAYLNERLKQSNVENVYVVHTLTGGIPEEEIINISETYKPDLIVMGTHGKGEKDILTGKISSKVVQNATCRVLTIPRTAEYHGFDNLLYATDFNDEDIYDLQRLIDLLVNYNPVIHCLHINLDDDHAADESKMEILKSHFREKTGEGRLVFRVIEDKDFLRGINNYVKENNIDIISIVNHRKSFLKRLFTKDHTRELLFHSDLPLYIFPGVNN